MSTGNPFSSPAFPADPTDVPMQLQVYVNSITLASVSAQAVILATFLNDLAVLPVALKVLSLTSLVASMMSALTVFLSNNLTCNPGICLGCYLWWIGTFGKWATYTLRIWALSKRNMWVLGINVVLILFASITFIAYCSFLAGVRALPRLCAPAPPASAEVFNDLSVASGALVNLSFIVSHVYYLRDYYAKSVQGTGTKTKTANTSGGSRFAATLTLFSSSTLVMTVDMLQWIVRRIVEADPVNYFIVVWGAQLIADLIYCTYMRAFASELQKAASQGTALRSGTTRSIVSHSGKGEAQQGGRMETI